MPFKSSQKIFFLTTFKLCDNNGYTSTQISNFFTCNGFNMVETPDEADCIVISTCGFDQERENQSRHIIEQYIDRFSKYKNIIICGCLTKINPTLFNQNNVITIGPKNLNEFNSLFDHRIKIEDVTGGKLNDRFIDRNYGIFDSYYIQICQGCINNCTYCAIKKAKGYVTSKPLDRVVRELGQAIESGYKHIMLLGDDCGSYGIDLGIDFSDLLNNLVHFDVGISINYVEPGRFLHLYPKLQRNALERIQFINIPIQSKSNRIIRLMGRHYDVDDALRLMQEVKHNHPLIYLETHMMYGFPTESRDEFENSFSVAEYFDSVIYFYYTDRTNVQSSLLDGKISKSEIDRRTQTILNHPIFQTNRDDATPPMIMLGYDLQTPDDIFKSIEGSLIPVSEINLSKEGQHAKSRCGFHSHGPQGAVADGRRERENNYGTGSKGRSCALRGSSDSPAHR